MHIAVTVKKWPLLRLSSLHCILASPIRLIEVASSVAFSKVLPYLIHPKLNNLGQQLSSNRTRGIIGKSFTESKSSNYGKSLASHSRPEKESYLVIVNVLSHTTDSIDWMINNYLDSQILNLIIHRRV